jgi:hypothetical protein
VVPVGSFAWMPPCRKTTWSPAPTRTAWIGQPWFELPMMPVVTPRAVDSSRATNGSMSLGW